jgi:hypothetical protein
MSAQAAIVVTHTGAPSASTCTLAQAINAANAANGVTAASVGSSTPPGNCTGASAGINYVTFSGWPTITLTGVDNYWYGPNALPPIASIISIGNYPGTGATLVASHVGDPTPATANAFRLFYVSGGLPGELPAGNLLLSGMTLKGGYAKGGDAGFGGGGAGMGGAIFNQGNLGLYGVSLIGNVAQGGNAGQGSKIGGGGMGQDGTDSGGGFGGSLGGLFGGGGGGPGYCRGGGGGGFVTGSDGRWGAYGNTYYGGYGGGKGRLGGRDWYTSRNSYYANSGGDGGDGGGYGNRDGSYCIVGIASGSGGRFGAGGGAGGIHIHNSYGDYYQGTGGGGGVGGGGGGGFYHEGGGGGFGGGGGRGAGGGFGGGDGGSGGSGLGGAIFNHRGITRLLNVTATGNAARGGSPNGRGLGAVLFNLNGIATVEFSTLAANALSGSAGSNGTLYSQAYGNKIEDGSASAATLNLSKNIVVATQGPVAGSGNDDVAATLSNGDQANMSAVNYLGPNLIAHVNTIAGVVQSGSAPSSADPLLGSPSVFATAPHPSFTMLPIGTNSPAYNATSCTETDATTNNVDGRRIPRPQPGGNCDIGAFEFDGDYIFAHDFNQSLKVARQDYVPAHCAAVANTLDIYWEEVDGFTPACTGIEHTNGSLADAADGTFSMTGQSVTNACLATAAYSFTLSFDKRTLTGSDTANSVPMTLSLSKDGACFVGHWVSDGYDFVATIWKFPSP